MTTASDENRLAIWVHQYTGEFYLSSIFKMQIFDTYFKWTNQHFFKTKCFDWDFWAWADQGVDE